MERISALMDGELDAAESRRALDALKERPDLADGWATFHAIGDAMRREPAAYDVARRVRARLADEPTVLAPRVRPHGLMQRVAMPAVAVAAAVGAVSWIAFAPESPIHSGSTPVAEIRPAPAMQPVAVTQGGAQPVGMPAQGSVVGIEPGIPFDRSGLTPYIFAHQEFSPSTMMQGVASYIRTVANGASETDR